MQSNAKPTLAGAATPALVLDLGRLKANCERMKNRCRALGARLRPHMKTLKSIDAARYAIDPSHGGIAVATLNEAEYFSKRGLTDIQCAVCISPVPIVGQVWIWMILRMPPAPDSPLEGNGFELPVPVRQAKLTRSCR